MVDEGRTTVIGARELNPLVGMTTEIFLRPPAVMISASPSFIDSYC
ncbi:hypothetical protein ACWEOV_38535 [Streptomyces sp. NPDC004365]